MDHAGWWEQLGAIPVSLTSPWPRGPPFSSSGGRSGPHSPSCPGNTELMEREVSEPGAKAEKPEISLIPAPTPPCSCRGSGPQLRGAPAAEGRGDAGHQEPRAAGRGHLCRPALEEFWWEPPSAAGPHQLWRDCEF